MLLETYLNSTEQNRRILIVSDLTRGQALVRKHEAVTGEMVRNLTCMTLSQMADAIYMYVQSETGYTSQYEILDWTDSLMVFRSILFDDIKSLGYFNKEKMMDLVTTNEIFSKINLIRGNGWTGAETGAKNSRVTDLKHLIAKYEQRLSDEHCMDQISLLKYIVAEMKKWTNPEQELRNIFAAEISYLSEDTDYQSGIEKEFLTLLQNGENHSVEVYGTDISVDSLTECKTKSEFFRGYGSFNEASYVANDILEKQVPYGNVAVLYSSQTQLPAITSALKGSGLNVKVVSDYPAQDNPFISLARRIIAWAQNDYSEKALEKVLSSAVICVEVDDGTGTKKNVLAGQAYFDYILDAAERRNDSFVLGWGYSRNADFVNHEKPLATEDRTKKLLEMHSELLGIFGDAGKVYDDKNKVLPGTVYKKLVAFMEKYTSSNEDFAVGLDAIRRLSGPIGLEDRSLSLQETLAFIDELLLSVSVKDTPDVNAVTVRHIRDWVLLDRPYVYVIGLSLKDMQGGETESPILSDEEMVAFLGDGYKPTVKANAEQKDLNLYRTLMSFTGESIVFGFSSYDTVGFCENNPSSFFREALQKFKGTPIKNLPEFVYGNPTIRVEIAFPAGVPDKAVYGVRLATSNSTIEELLDCPKKYFYDKEKHVPENEYTESDYSRWLDARSKGSFFHEIADQYVKEKLVKPATDCYDAAADTALIEEIAKAVETKMLVEIPVAFTDLADRETADLVEAASNYLGELHAKLNATGWRALLTEQRFANAVYTVEAYDKHVYEFEFTGFIDRIDYKADAQSKKIYLRIIDYKTGKKDSKKKENDLGKLFQYAVYEKALMENGCYVDDYGMSRLFLDVVREKIAALESLTDIDQWHVEFDSFQYVFPMETSDREPLVIAKEELEGINLTRLKCILTAIQDKKTYPDHIELYEAVKNYEMKYGAMDPELAGLSAMMEHRDKSGAVKLSEAEIDHCRYCSYGSLCAHRKAGDL